MQRFTDTRTADTPDEIWFVEHPPIFTLGLNAKDSHVIDAGDIPVLRIDRGGQVTYHGPGQVGLDPATMKLVEGGVEAQARRALQNVQAIVEAAGGRLADVVKATVFLTSMADFKAVNAVYAEFFPENPPARSAVAVAELPAGASVEIEAIAFWK